MPIECEQLRRAPYARESRKHWPPSCMPDHWALYFNPVFRHLLTPGLRARLEARTAEHRRQFSEDLRRSAREWERKKALKAAAKKAAKRGQPLLFNEEEAG